MARKHLIYSYKMIDAGDMSVALTSSEVEVAQLDNASVHVEWTSTAPDAQLTVEAKNGKDDSWYQLEFNTSILVNTSNSFVQIVLNELPFTHIRLQYTVNGATTGTISATITSKTVGA